MKTLSKNDWHLTVANKVALALDSYLVIGAKFSSCLPDRTTDSQIVALLDILMHSLNIDILKANNNIMPKPSVKMFEMGSGTLLDRCSECGKVFEGDTRTVNAQIQVHYKYKHNMALSPFTPDRINRPFGIQPSEALSKTPLYHNG
jgi:hypothetical protein